MFELVQRYYNLLLIMRQGYGNELNFTSNEISPRIMVLVSLICFKNEVLDWGDFTNYLSSDWNWHIYCKVINELRILGGIEGDKPNIENCKKIIKEFEILHVGEALC